MLKLECTFTWKGGRSEGCHKLGSGAQAETPWRHAGNIRTWLILAVGGEEESKGMLEFLSCLVPLKYGLQSSADPPFLQEPIDYNTGLPSVSHNSCEKSQDLHLSLSLQQHDGHPAATLPRSYSHCARGVSTCMKRCLNEWYSAQKLKWGITYLCLPYDNYSVHSSPCPFSCLTFSTCICQSKWKALCMALICFESCYINKKRLIDLRINVARRHRE